MLTYKQRFHRVVKSNLILDFYKREKEKVMITVELISKTNRGTGETPGVIYTGNARDVGNLTRFLHLYHYIIARKYINIFTVK